MLHAASETDKAMVPPEASQSGLASLLLLSLTTQLAGTRARMLTDLPLRKGFVLMRGLRMLQRLSLIIKTAAMPSMLQAREIVQSMAARGMRGREGSSLRKALCLTRR